MNKMPPTPWYLPIGPAYHEVTPADLVMEAFRKLFTASLYRVIVSPDGRTMRIRMTSEALSERLALAAWGIITANNLPLAVRTDVFRMGSLVFDRTLVVKYTGQELPICY